MERRKFISVVVSLAVMVIVMLYTTFFFYSDRTLGELWMWDIFLITLLGACCGAAVAFLLMLPWIGFPNGLSLGIIGVFVFGLFSWLYIGLNIFNLRNLGNIPLNDVGFPHLLTVAGATLAVLFGVGFLFYRSQFFEKSGFIIAVTFGFSLLIMYYCFTILYWDKPFGRLGSYDLLCIALFGLVFGLLDLVIMKLAHIPLKFNLACIGIVLFAFILWPYVGPRIEIQFLFWQISSFGNVMIGDVPMISLLIVLALTASCIFIAAIILQFTVVRWVE